MRNHISETETHILETCAEHIARDGKSSLNIVELARSADVAVATVYYHFSSKKSLVAMAQAHNYIVNYEEQSESLASAERSVLVQDEDKFWSAMSDLVSLAWSLGQPMEGWTVIETLLDIKSDAVTFEAFTQENDRRFQRWMAVLEAAKTLDWVNSSIDIGLLVVNFWSASIGQVIFSGSSGIDCSPERFKEYFLSSLRPATTN